MPRRYEGVAARPSSVLTAKEWGLIASALALTNRELEISQHLCDGARDVDIGATLGVSAHTVHSHLQRMYAKTSTRNRAEFIVRLFTTHLRSLPRTAAPAIDTAALKAM